MNFPVRQATIPATTPAAGLDRGPSLALTALVVLAWLVTAGGVRADQPAGATDGSSSTEVRVITYNIRYLNRNDGPDHWDHRVDAVAGLIATGDVVGLQEALYTQIDNLVERLEDFDWYGVGRDDAREAGEFSPIFWRKSRFEAVRSGTFWLGPDPTAVGKLAWEARIPRICSWVVLRPITGGSTGGGEFAVFNTHFDHQSRLARKNSATLILAKIAEIAPNMPLIFMGDLNCRPDSEPVSILTHIPSETGDGAIRLVDTITQSQSPAEGPSGTWNAFKQIEPGNRIDYIMIPPDSFRVKSHVTADPKTANGRFASDHLPVIVTLQP